MSTAALDPIQTISPIDGQTIGTFQRHTPDQVEAIIGKAAAAQRGWAALSFDERAAALRRIASALRERSTELASLVTVEMGKTIGEARAEVEKSAWAFDHYADHGEEMLATEPIGTSARETFVQFPPLGVVFAVMPWNYPVWQVMRAAAPALMAGNTIVLKHASNVLGCARAIRDLFAEADVPDCLLDLIVIGHGEIEAVIGDDRIRAVTLTGSEAAGIAVATACARHLKKSVLELGGSDPFIVLADADVEAAVAAGVRGRFLNAGQSCIAAKRFVLSEAIAEEFEAAFAARVSDLRVGDPREEGSDLGPMARADLRDELAEQVDRGLRSGGRLLCGGADVEDPGAWFLPTVVTDVVAGNPLAAEETFGPAAALLRASDDRAAIMHANDTPYGLSSSLWSRDVDRAKRLARDVEAGAVFVNGFSASDPRVPFGGVKRSGWGRELGSWGIREFVNVQAVTVA